MLADKPLLTAVLPYHVLPAKVAKADIKPGLPNTTVQGAIFKIDTAGAGLRITDGPTARRTSWPPTSRPATA